MKKYILNDEVEGEKELREKGVGLEVIIIFFYEIVGRKRKRDAEEENEIIENIKKMEKKKKKEKKMEEEEDTQDIERDPFISKYFIKDTIETLFTKNKRKKLRDDVLEIEQERKIFKDKKGYKKQEIRTGLKKYCNSSCDENETLEWEISDDREDNNGNKTLESEISSDREDNNGSKTLESEISDDREDNNESEEEDKASSLTDPDSIQPLTSLEKKKLDKQLNKRLRMLSITPSLLEIIKSVDNGEILVPTECDDFLRLLLKGVSNNKDFLVDQMVSVFRANMYE
jgi:hypothetical protein